MKKNNILTVIKKEFARFFGDRRMLISVFLPSIMIYLLYSVMGDGLMSSMMPDEETVYTLQVENLPDSMNPIFHGEELPFIHKTETDPKAAVTDGNLDLYILFPENFEADMIAGKAPEIKIYYNSTATTSSMAYSIVAGVLDEMESTMQQNFFDVNRTSDEVFDLATEEDMTGMIMSMMMPMLLMTLMFSGCMAVASESIAGEKERGTIATLLVTPMKRSHLAVGKIAALSAISLLSGLSSFLGVLLSLPKLMGGEDMGMMDAGVYAVSDYAWILGIILSTVLLFVSLISVISTLASTVKEAASMISPLMILVTVIGVSGMFGGEMQLWKSLIPVYNSVQCISGVFAMDYEPLHVLIAICVNCATAGLLTLVLTRLFNSEKVMFKK